MSATTHQERMRFALEVLDGLSVGDAVGEALSYQSYRAREISDFSIFRDGTVRFTDDTEMAIGICEMLRTIKSVDEDHLAWIFSSRFRRDPERGYGRMARKILQEIASGTDWKTASSSAFSGGSFGNGAAMRVAPLGAYYYDALPSIPALTSKTAMVTHFHPEGIAGAVAVALASASALQSRGTCSASASKRVWEDVMQYTPDGRTWNRLERARSMSGNSPLEVAREVGNGTEISAPDTVPFCVWNACRCLDDYKEAIISTIEVGGDCDTNAAIVGGIVTAYLGVSGIPEDWLRVREPLRFRD